MTALDSGAGSFLSHLTTRRQPTRLISCIVISLVALFILYLLLFGTASWPSSLTNLSYSPNHDQNIPTLRSSPQHIPKKIWQISLPYLDPDVLTSDTITSFVTHSPSHSYSILDSTGADALLTYVAATYPKYSHIRSVYDAMNRTVMRADFLRYLVLATEGGLYSDADTVMMRSMADWVPESLKNHTKLIVGIEADAGRDGDLVAATKYRVQFCQWTMAGAAGHPVFWRMVDRIIQSVEQHETEGAHGFSDWEVLEIGGPVGWSDIVYGYLSDVVEEKVTWESLTGLRYSKLFRDVLVLPIDGFATGVGHSGASKKGENKEGTMVVHSFNSSWQKKKKGGPGW